MTTTGATPARADERPGARPAGDPLKEAARRTWALGDYPAIAERELWPVGERIIKRLGVRPTEVVLDVGCGTGNAAIRAALAGARTIGVDLTPELLAVARQVAARSGVEVDWREGDAEALPLDDASVDVVVSTFACELAPRHRVVAHEIARVLRPGGRLGLCVWPPDGTMGRIMKTVAAYLPAPPPGAEPPLLWGDEDHVRSLFAATGVDVQFERTTLEHEPFPSGLDDVEWHAARFGPLIQARAQRGSRWPLARAARRTRPPPRPPHFARLSRRARQQGPAEAMSEHVYDAIVVGARCAGAPTAMLLARHGYDVLLVDRAHFPSDTVSTHLVHPPGVVALERWGLLDRLVATGCPPVSTYSFDFGPVRLAGTPSPDGEPAVAYCPRRTVLDALLVDAASEAGAEVREGFTFDQPVFDHDTVTGIRGATPSGAAVEERARIVIGADGAHSRVAAAVAARRYQEKPTLSVGYYSYWSDFPVDAAEWLVRPGNGYGAFPTNDGLTMLLAAWPHAALREVKRDIEASYQRALEAGFGERLGGARRQERIVGGGVPNHFRVPYGPGWALVGDAGYLRDPVTAQGITDAFLDAERCTTALHTSLASDRPFEDAMADYQQQRERTCARHVRLHLPARHPRTSATRAATPPRCHRRQPHRHEPFRQPRRRHPVAHRLLRAGPHRDAAGRGPRKLT